MKQLKFLMAALLMVMGVTLSSCLDSDSGDSTSRVGIGKVYSNYGSYSFKDLQGYTIIPTYASVASQLSNGNDLSKYVGDVVYFGYDIASATTDESAKTVTDVTFNGCFSLNSPVEVVEGTATDKAPNDSIENTPIISLKNGYDVPGFVFDNHTLYLPTNYTMTNAENYISLVYYTDEEENNDDSLCLHLRYNSKGNKVSSPITSKDYTYYNLAYYMNYFDLSDVFYAHMSKHNLTAFPTKIKVLTKENSYSTSLDDDQTKENTYIIEYKAPTDK